MISFKNIKVTGDIHNEFNRLLWFQNNKNISENELLIFTGDCWLFTSPENSQLLDDISSTIAYTIAFVDGNHEHFGNLNSFPIEEYWGGKVHFLRRKNIIHLMRGQVYSIPVQNETRKIFTFGGGNSVDKEGRIEGRTWFPEEMPNEEEYNEAWINLEKHNNCVDYIMTHTCCTEALENLKRYLHRRYGFEEFYLNDFLQKTHLKCQYKHWYFGHMHLSEIQKVPELNQTCLYDGIITLE